MTNKAKQLPFLVYSAVRGLASEGLPVKVGNVEFAVFDDSQVARFRDLPDRQGRTPEQKQAALESIERMVEEKLVGTPIALVQVPAPDVEAARILAKSELRKTLDVINFFSDLIPYSPGYVYLPGDVEATVESIPVMVDEDKPSFYLQQRMVGPIGQLSFKRLVERDREKDLGFMRTSQLLALPNKGKLHQGILSAIQWAGRATVEKRKEEAFLLYAIALESLILIEGDKNELNYRLKIRTAHLLGNDVEGRKAVAGHIQKLYKKRSSIVHAGDIQVTDDELKLLRYITKSCILRVLTEPVFTSMNSAEELVSWFDERILQ